MTEDIRRKAYQFASEIAEAVRIKPHGGLTAPFLLELQGKAQDLADAVHEEAKRLQRIQSSANRT
jgi:hypothetical protein